MKRRSMGALLFLGIALVPYTGTRAQTAIDAKSFRLSTQEFPPGSEVIAAHVEPNRRIHRDNVLHFGTAFGKAGRLTGYFMEAIEGKKSFPRVDTSYLVSIFGTSHDARAAFNEQKYFWDVGSGHSALVPLPGGLYGAGESEGLFSTVWPTGTTLTELLFQRGQIFVEVFQQVNIEAPSDADVQAFFAIGRTLDDLVRVSQGP